MKVLVVGSGAREHALVRSLSLDPSVDAVVAAPGNPGIEAVARCEPLPGGVTDAAGVVALAVSLGVDLVVIGPEAPLVAGVADAVRDAGIPCFGPSAEAARLEGSKAFAKDVMSAAEVPTGMAHVCTTVGRGRGGARRPRRPARRQGRRAGRRQGGRRHRRPGRGARAREGLPGQARRRGRHRGVPLRARGVAVLHLRRRDGRAAGARPGLQAGRRRRRRAEHRAGWGPTARSTGHPRGWSTTSWPGSPSRSSTRCAGGAPPSPGCSTSGWR